MEKYYNTTNNIDLTFFCLLSSFLTLLRYSLHTIKYSYSIKEEIIQKFKYLDIVIPFEMAKVGNYLPICQ